MKASPAPGLKVVPVRAASPDTPSAKTAQVVPCLKQGWGDIVWQRASKAVQGCCSISKEAARPQKAFLNPSLKKEPRNRKETKQLLPAIYQLAQIQ